jgi:Holliday junction resolvase
MTASSTGLKREGQVRKLYEAEGWICVRAAGSLGPVDLVAIRKGFKPIFNEIKATSTPWVTFGRAKRNEMLRICELAGATPMLVYWPAHKKPRWILAKDWPPS